MKLGNWVPLSKAFVKTLPHGRPYSEVEAAFSLQCDYDNDKAVTYTGYSKLWGWGKKRTLRFFRRLGIEIRYSEPTLKKRNQRGLITTLKGDQSTRKKGLIRFIDYKRLGDKGDQSQGKRGLKGDQSRPTTIDPIDPNPKKPAKKRAKSIPSKFEVTTQMRSWFDNKGLHVSIGIETEKFINHAKSKGRKCVDWVAAWRNWMIQAEQYLPKDNSADNQQQLELLSGEALDQELTRNE